jgi:predicted PurR-regulated permease PerM
VSPATPDRIVYVQPLTPARVMVLTLSVLFVIGVVWFVIQVREIVLLLILGILIATAIEPIVNMLRRRGLARGPVILALYLLVFALIGLGLLIAVPVLYAQGQALAEGAPQFLADVQTQLENSRSVLIRTYGSQAMASAIEFTNRFQESPPLQVEQAAEFVGSFVELLFAVISIMIVTFYWMTEKAAIKRFFLGLVSIERRDRAHEMWDEIESKAGGWARGQVILMLVLGVVSTIAYSPLIFNLKFWVFLGIWAGLMELIPFIGPWLGGGLAVLVALTDSWQKALLVVAFVFIINQLEASFLVPRVMRNAVGLSPLSVILAVLVGGAILGPLGAILSIPVAAVAQVLVTGLLHEREAAADVSSAVAARSRREPEPSGPAPPQLVDVEPFPRKA